MAKRRGFYISLKDMAKKTKSSDEPREEKTVEIINPKFIGMRFYDKRTNTNHTVVADESKFQMYKDCGLDIFKTVKVRG